MKSYKPLLILFLIVSVSVIQVRAQTIEILGGNTLNGALTGTMLGAATMGLQNSNDFTPLRIGLGAGTIAGAGVGIYDVATLPRGEQLFVAGFFNDGNNSSIIILLDTFYGAAAGGILGSAGMLISNSPIRDGLQYGSSIGAWIGFGFGLIDSFVFAERNRDFIGSSLLQSDTLFSISYDQYKVGLVRPTLYQTASVYQNEISSAYQPVLELLSLKMKF